MHLCVYSIKSVVYECIYMFRFIQVENTKEKRKNERERERERESGEKKAERTK